MTNKDKISDIDDFQNSNTYNTSDDSDDSKFTGKQGCYTRKAC